MMKVREIIRAIEIDGWYMVAQEASHRQFRHPAKLGRVTIAGNLGDDVPPGTLGNILRQAGLKKGGNRVEYLVILEKAENNWAAYSPDVPGCIATGNTSEETLQEYQEALRMHLKGLIEDGLPLPEPSAKAMYVKVS